MNKSRKQSDIGKGFLKRDLPAFCFRENKKQIEINLQNVSDVRVKNSVTYETNLISSRCGV